MTYNRAHVRELLNAGERELFEASLAKPIKALTDVQLRSRVRRTRTLRDKYRDLLRRQKIATRARTGSKTGTTGVANQRTDKKIQVLNEVLARYEARQAQLDAAEKVASAKPAVTGPSVVKPAGAARAKKTGAKRPAARGATSRSRKAPAKVPSSTADLLGPTGERARAKRFASQQLESGSQRIQAHVGARVRRSQAKRDSRG